MATTPHVLSTGNFSQNWSSADLITANDDWSNVAAIVGYLGDIDSGSSTNVDPRTLTGADLGAVDVIANQAATTITNGGVAEFDTLGNPTVALQGSGTADAPSLVIYLDATGRSDVRLTFDARDIDGSSDDAAQQIAVQYRLGNSGSWTNVTGGYAADVTTSGTATQSTPFDLTLPEAVNGRSDLQVRILTTNAGGSDEWVGIDNIAVTSAPAVETQKVGFAVDSLSLSLVEGDTGTQLLTFTVERTGGTTGEVSFSGSFLAGDTAADDFATLITGFAGIIADGLASTTVTIEVNGDTEIELDEAFSLTLTDVENSGGVETTILDARATAQATILNDDAAAATVIGGIEILDMAESLTGSVTAPVATETLTVTRRGSWDSGDGEGGSESITFDDTTARAYVTNAASDRIDVLDLSNPFAPAKVAEIDLSTLPGYGEVNSVAAYDGIIAVAVQNADGGEAGLVALYDGDGTLIKTLTVGVLPDQLTFSPDGKLLLVANEGEPYLDEGTGETVNAPGSVTIIDMSGGAVGATVRNTVGFTALDGFEDQLSDLGLKIFGGNSDLEAPTASQDIEPEYVAVSPDGTKAYVTLQEVNAVAVIDLTDTDADKPVSILPAGYVDFSLAGNEADFSDRDGGGGARVITVGNTPVKGLLQPDAIASFEIDGATYFITANEGDTRIVQNGSEGLNEARASSFGVTDTDYARYNLDTVWTTSADDLYGFGGRGVSIFKQNLDGTIEKVNETGGDFEQILAALPNASTVFNGENGGSFDTRSDNKGAEPEGVTVGEVNGKMYAFVALERIGGVMVWDVSTPEDAKYVDYIAPTSEDYGPEVIKFVAAEDSPTGRALLMTANEISGTVTVYDLEDPAVTKISAIQGEGEASALVGQTVTVEAIVVGDFQNGDGDDSRNLGGFYIQEEKFDEDGNPLTSEGIFVYGGTGDVNVGDRVRVTATVSEYFGMTQLNATSIAVIEAGAVADINEMATTISLPAADVTLSQDGDYQPDLEAYEGMLVTVEQELTITEQFNLDRFNEIKLVAGERPAQFTQENAPDAAAYAAYLEALGTRTITYDDGLNVQNAAITNLDGFDPYSTETAPRMGDTITGLTGVLDYQWAGNSASGSTWRIRSVEDGTNTFEEGTPREDAPEDVGGRLTVASLNVLNYFTTIDTISDSSSDQPGDNTAAGFDPRGADSDAEFARQTEKLVGTILSIDPDVLALVEIENDFLAGSDGNALEYLVDQLNAELGAEIYAWVDPGTQFVGGDAIAVGFIYKPSEVTVAYDTTIEILDDGDLSALGLDSLLDQSTVDGVFNGVNTSRAALAVTFEEVETGETFTAIANHLKSKSGTGTDADADQLDGQGAWQQQRELAATALTAWAESDPTGSGDGDVLLLGDFNAYAKEDAIGILEEAGFESLETRLEDPYSYVFDGQTGSLDYIFANETLAAQVTGVTHWHINSDEADALDYNTDFGRDPSIFDADSPVRTSDHDPLIIGLNLEEEPPVSTTYTLQLLHFSDGEAGLLASETAPNLAALVDAYDDDYGNTLILAGGDNWLPGPFLAAGTDPAVRDAINEVTGSTMTGTIPIAAADIAIHNVIGVEASALGNHDFDLGSNVLAASLTPGSGWVGAQFVSVSANLVVGPSSPYYTDPTATDSALNAIYVDTVDYNVQPGVDQPATTTAIPEASTLKGKIVPAAVVTEGGEKIGIVGVTTQILETISSPSGAEIAGFPGGTGANGEVDDMDLLAAQLQPIIDEMIAEGVDKIILQSHLQIIGNEIELAGKLKGVDIILSAGSNTRMGDADDEAVAFPGHAADFALDYPYLGADAEGNPILIVNTDNEYTYLGRLVVDFDENGHIITDSLTANQAINGAIAATEENVAEAWETTVDNLDATAFAEGTKGGDVKTITEAVQGVIDVKDGNVYGYSDVYLEGERGQVRNQETNLGNLSADANAGSFTSALKDALGNEAEGAYVVSIKNGGGIRAQIGTLSAPDPVDGTVDKLPPEGGVSQLDVENSLRFDNKLITFDTTPEGLKAIIEHGVASYGNQGRFPQIGGVSFSFDPDAVAGSRVLDMALVDADGNVLVQLYDDGVLLDDVPAEISVVTLNFLADGGDGYPMKANGENFRYLLADGSLGPVLDESQLLVPLAPTDAMGEQLALERYMRANHATEETAYDLADTDMAGDERIQNLNARAEDTVLVSEQVTFSGDADADMFEGGALADILSGNAGNDMLKGHGGTDLLRGGAGDDLLFGGTGDDILLGGAGADEIYGGDQDDEIEGGRGDDMLIGGNGSDTYSYEQGDGSDTIAEGEGLEDDMDALVFQDIESDQVAFTVAGNDVVIRLEDGSLLTLKDQMLTGGVEEIVFADGETLSRQAILGSLENAAPVAADDTLAAVAEDAAAFTIPFAELLANDTDGEGATLTIAGLKNVVGGTAQITETGVRFTPAANFNGQASFEYIVSDGEDTDEAKASFTITPVNDAPVATDDAGSVSETESKLFDLLVNDSDVDGGALSLAGFEVTAVSGLNLDAEDAAAAFSIVGGKLAFAPGDSFAGLDAGETAQVTVAYQLSDGQGGTDVGAFVLDIAGESSLNQVVGTNQRDQLRGTTGDDQLLGLGGNDNLRGNAGADVIDGGAGNDQLRGGGGNDVFVFRSGYGRDTVFDFQRGADVIEIDADVYADFDAMVDAGAITTTGAFFFRAATITLDDGSQMLLRGVNGASLSADDFRFV